MPDISGARVKQMCVAFTKPSQRSALTKSNADKVPYGHNVPCAGRDQVRRGAMRDRKRETEGEGKGERERNRKKERGREREREMERESEQERGRAPECTRCEHMCP